MSDNTQVVVMKVLLLNALTETVKGVPEDKREALREAVWGTPAQYEAWVEAVYGGEDVISVHSTTEDVLKVIKEELSKLSSVIH